MAPGDEGYEMDMFCWRFENAFQAFVAAGGLDEVPRMSEDWERVHRKSTYCQHGVVFKACAECHVERRPYLADYYGN